MELGLKENFTLNVTEKKKIKLNIYYLKIVLIDTYKIKSIYFHMNFKVSYSLKLNNYNNKVKFKKEKINYVIALSNS